MYSDNDEKVKIKIPSPECYFFNLKGKQLIQIEPRIKGKAGFYTTLYFRSMSEEKIHCRLILQKGKAKKEIAHIQKMGFNSSFIRNLDIGKKEKIILSFTGEGIVAFSVPIIYSKNESKEKNYIFMIGADTLRADYVGKNINGNSLTPNIDLFKKNSADFTNAYSQSSWTLPAFMSLFTSLYEFNHGVTRGASLDQEKPFLVRELSKKFLTFSYNGGAFVGKKYGFSRGFDLYTSLASLIRSGSGKIMFDTAIKLIERTEFPDLFLFLHTYQLHSPYAPDLEFLYKINSEPELLKFGGYHAKKKYKRVDENKVRAFREVYQAEILEFDHYFGEFIRKLKAMGLYNSSMIIFMSDHGEEFYEHKAWTHGHSLYNELIKIPLIIKFPHNEYKGVEISEDVGIIDIFPTILEACEVKFNSKSVDGESLLPLLNGKKLNRKTLYSSLSTGWMIDAIPPKFSIISKDSKLIFNYPFISEKLPFFNEDSRPPQIDRIEFFDIRKDKSEKDNIINQKEMPNIFRPRIEELRMAINKALATKKRGKIILSKEELEKLRALGYIN
ncbi:sulfatase-like hydrolase/transferase [Patescibacteria group bacterium]|nr:sulfatase-like hydrolase/transferase [Patescibacteria group bacterium]